MDNRHEFLVSAISALCDTGDAGRDGLRDGLREALRSSEDARAFLDDFR